MAKLLSIKRRFLTNLDFSIRLLKNEVYQKHLFNFFTRYQSQCSKSEKVDGKLSNELKDGGARVPLTPMTDYEANSTSKYSSDEEDYNWKPELAWLNKALEPALQLCRRALPTVNGNWDKPPPSTRSLSEIYTSIQRSKIGLKDWSLGDLTIGLYLIYLQQASRGLIEEVNGELVSSEAIIHDLIYHLELAKGAYKGNTRILAKTTMLREKNVVKFVTDSSVLRPGYYIGVDKRKRLVILCIRGTHSVYDLITDVVSSNDEEISLDGYLTHFGTAEAARWFFQHELETLRKCLQEHEGFRLRLVGHSLGGAAASLLAIMLRQKSAKELGFDPEIVSAIGYATPPCLSKEQAESCSKYVSTVVMQDDIIPRLSSASLARLRNEILQTDWASVFEKEDWKQVVDLVANAKQFVSSVQDVTRKLVDFAKFRGQDGLSDTEITAQADEKSGSGLAPTDSTTCAASEGDGNVNARSLEHEELVVPGTLYYLKRNVMFCEQNDKQIEEECYTLWKRHSGEHFQQILLSGNLISDHKCDSHLYALRDVLKGLPGHDDETIFTR